METNNCEMTYAQYISIFHHSKRLNKMSMQLDLPITINELGSISEEEMFLRTWDMSTFGLSSGNNKYARSLWLEKEMQKNGLQFIG
jgi:hypothetical protein